jgi:hypothetical protein
MVFLQESHSLLCGGSVDNGATGAVLEDAPAPQGSGENKWRK